MSHPLNPSMYAVCVYPYTVCTLVRTLVLSDLRVRSLVIYLTLIPYPKCQRYAMVQTNLVRSMRAMRCELELVGRRPKKIRPFVRMR